MHSEKMDKMNLARVDCHLVKRALSGLDDECGDTGVITMRDGVCFVALVDVLGHGPEAHEVALMADSYLAGHADMPLDELMDGLHRHLQGTRGGVAAFCRLDSATGEMEFIGIGNISSRIFGVEEQRLLSRDGVVGYMASVPKAKAVWLSLGDVVVLHSDGIAEHFRAHDCPGLLTGSAKEIAGRIMSRFSKKDDDASCLVMRYVA